MLSLIAACDQNRLIGNKNQLPWHLPADLQHFKALTLNKTLLMGRSTFESIGRPLPQRRNMVLSRQANYHPAGVEVVHSLEQALRLVTSDTEIMVIGGSQIYQLCLPLAQRIYLTCIDAQFDGDAWFPKLDCAQWQEISRQDGKLDEKNIWAHQFVCLERRTTNV